MSLIPEIKSAKEENKDPDRVKICIVYEDKILRVRVNKSKSFERIFKTANDKLQKNNLKFYYMGKRIWEDQKLKDVGVMDNAAIQASDQVFSA